MRFRRPAGLSQPVDPHGVGGLPCFGKPEPDMAKGRGYTNNEAATRTWPRTIQRPEDSWTKALANYCEIDIIFAKTLFVVAKSTSF